MAKANKDFGLEVKVFPLKNNNKTAAMVSFTVKAGEVPVMVCSGFKLMEGKNGLFLSCPSYQKKDKSYQDITFPLSKEIRERMQELALDAYSKDMVDTGTPVTDDDIPF